MVWTRWYFVELVLRIRIQSDPDLFGRIRIQTFMAESSYDVKDRIRIQGCYNWHIFNFLCLYVCVMTIDYLGIHVMYVNFFFLTTIEKPLLGQKFLVGKILYKFYIGEDPVPGSGQKASRFATLLRTTQVLVQRIKKLKPTLPIKHFKMAL
jgi:hypothetical protein